MLLHVHEWGDPAAPPLVCLHGVTAHGRRFRRLAEERLARRFHVLAPDLRGHGRSGWEPPWNIATHAGDLLETVAVERASWLGMTTDAPPFERLRVPTLLVLGARSWLVLDHHLDGYRAALGELLEVVTVPGGHTVLWDAYEQTADAVEAFLAA